jgi:hypothetical protein
MSSVGSLRRLIRGLARLLHPAAHVLQNDPQPKYGLIRSRNLLIERVALFEPAILHPLAEPIQVGLSSGNHRGQMHIFLTRRAASGNFGRMTKKRLALIAVLPLAIAVILSVLAMLLPRPGVTKANVYRIHGGMARAEVESVFGRSSDGFLLTKEVRESFEVEDLLPSKPLDTIVESQQDCEAFAILERRRDTWAGDDGSVTQVKIIFVNDHVAEMECRHSGETIPDKIRRWFHLPKGK